MSHVLKRQHLAPHNYMDCVKKRSSLFLVRRVARKNSVMPCIVRGTGKRYSWRIGEAPLHKVANREKKMPRSYISRDGYGITAAAHAYLEPLIAGEDYPAYRNGMPQYTTLKNVPVPRKLATDFGI